MCLPARVKTPNPQSEIQQQRVGSNAIRAERSEQESDRTINEFKLLVQ